MDSAPPRTVRTERMTLPVSESSCIALDIRRRREQILCVITSLENNLNSNSCMIQARRGKLRTLPLRPAKVMAAPLQGERAHAVNDHQTRYTFYH